ncbi:MAG: hypothetical protein ACLQK4_11180 [Acidimicrobiales bacterium]
MTPDRSLEDIEAAAGFLSDRGLLTRTPDCSLPSLFEACHEEPYKEGGQGFAAWPKTKWWWGDALAQRAGVIVLKIHSGKNIFLSREAVALVDPICRAELARMTAAEPSWARVLDYLADVGPAQLETVRRDLGIVPPELKSLRSPLERCGALVSRPVVLGATGTDGSEAPGHVHTSELARYDQVVSDATPGDPMRAFGDLVVAGVRAAVVAPEREIERWFSWRWYFDPGLVDRLVVNGRLERPAPGWVSAAPIAGA